MIHVRLATVVTAFIGSEERTKIVGETREQLKILEVVLGDLDVFVDDSFLVILPSIAQGVGFHRHRDSALAMVVVGSLMVPSRQILLLLLFFH